MAMPDRRTETSWCEDRHLSLDRLTPGQRYTLALIAILMVLLLKLGLPHAQLARPVSPGTPAGAMARPYPSNSLAP